MAELESVIENRLIHQLCSGESQWTYRPDIRTEEDLWNNFKYILEQNNKAKLDDIPLSESEFAKVKNDCHMHHFMMQESGLLEKMVKFMFMFKEEMRRFI